MWMNHLFVVISGSPFLCSVNLLTRTNTPSHTLPRAHRGKLNVYHAHIFTCCLSPSLMMQISNPLLGLNVATNPTIPRWAVELPTFS